MAVVTTRRVISHPEIPPGYKLRFGQLIGPPIDTVNGAIHPVSARSKTSLGPAEGPAAGHGAVRTAIITERDTKTGATRMRQERVVDDLLRIQGESIAEFNTRNKDHREAMRAEHEAQREHQQKIQELNAEEENRKAEALAEIEAKRMQAHDDAMEAAQTKVDAITDKAAEDQLRANVASGIGGANVERVQAKTLSGPLESLSGTASAPGNTTVTSVRTGGLDDTASSDKSKSAKTDTGKKS